MMRRIADVLGRETYALVKAIESGNVQFMQLPPDGGVSVQPRDRQ